MLCFVRNLRTKILDFRGFDSSVILMFSGGSIMSIGNVPESLSQAIFVGIILVGRLGVVRPGNVQAFCFNSFHQLDTGGATNP